MKTEKIYKQHEDNKEWANSLSFYKHEIKIMENRLGEIVMKNTSKDALAQVEHFQNQLIIQKDHSDRINHDININNDVISAEIEKNPTAIDHRSMPDHESLRNRIITFETGFNSLKKELNIFLSKYL